MKKICVITGSRAEYSLLYGLIKRFHEDPEVEFQLIVSGMHFASEFGSTYQVIEKDGFSITDRVDMLLSDDTADSMAKSFGIGVLGFTESLKRLQPEIIVVLGDRYEILAATIAATILHIPTAHIHGGEATEGAVDESFRHAITKLSVLHFTSTERYRQRVVQLGEQPENVFYTGALGVDNIRLFPLLEKVELSKKLQFDFEKPYLLITYHSETLNIEQLEISVSNLLMAVDEFKDFNIIFTKANADQGGRYINQKIEEYVATRKERAILYSNLGGNYLSVLKHAAVVIGNSSSAIIEAPALKTASVNIGNRQKGRLKDPSVIDCTADLQGILQAIKQSLDQEFLQTAFLSPSVYEGQGEGKTVAERIYNIIKNKELKSMTKAFYDLEGVIRV